MRFMPKCILCASIIFLCSIPNYSQALTPSWDLNEHCKKPNIIKLRIKLDSKILHRTSLFLCACSPKCVNPSGNGKIDFYFTAPRPLIWYGYRSYEGKGKVDPGDTTPKGSKLHVQFWPASVSTEILLLGYSVTDKNGCHMNSLHQILPTRDNSTQMAPGLTLETWPDESS